MTDATAKYVLSAEDRTRAAIASAKEAFKGLDETVKKVSESAKLMTELFVGARIISGIHRLTEAVVEASAEADEGFGGALDRVRESMAALMVPKGGLPEATERMNELAEVLKDPATIAAADKFTSILIRGFTSTAEWIAKVAGGLSYLINGAGEASMRIDDRITALQNERKDLLSSGNDDDAGISQSVNAAHAKQRIADIDKELIDLGKQYWAALDKEGAAARAAADASKALAEQKQHLIDAKVHEIQSTFDLKQAMAQVDEGGKWLEASKSADDDYIKELLSKSQRATQAYTDLVEASTGATRTALEKDLDAVHEWDQQLAIALAAGTITQEEATDRAKQHLDEILQPITISSDYATNFKKTVDSMSEYAKQASRDIQSSFADFLFDPFQDGLNGMLAGFLNVFRRMIAEIASKKILESTGAESWISTVLTHMFGSSSDGLDYFTPSVTAATGALAAGGPARAGGTYLIGEDGPELLQMGAQSGSVVPNDKLGGQPVINITTNMDNRHATGDFINAMPELLRRNNEQLEATMVSRMKGGSYGFRVG